MIRVENVCKKYPTRFGEKLVLDNVNFDLQKGDKLGILGRNGAGKSTLIRLISGAEAPTSGKIHTDMSVSWPLAFGGAFQENLTGIDNVRFISRIYDQDFDKNIAFVEDFSELGEYLREEVRTYSSGMRARLAFAISMITEFDCFLIDEISAVGDARFHAKCNYELFDQRSDRAMIIVSHQTSYINNHCNKFALLHDGKLRLFDDFEEAYSDFRNKIGLVDGQISKEPKAKLTSRTRKQLIENTATTAQHDEKFLNLVLEAHMRSQDKKWAQARTAYEAAFDLYPYHGAYWAQWAHMAKDEGDLALAEIGYRTSCALGESVGEMDEFFHKVMMRQKRHPKKFPLLALSPGPAAEQPPGIPDLTLFARAAWGVEVVQRDEMIALIRQHLNCDTLFADMVCDDRFADYHKDWLDEADGLAAKALKAKAAKAQRSNDAEVWAVNLACVAEVGDNDKGLLRIARSIATAKDALPIVLAHGGFVQWPKTNDALRKRFH